jgi:hypothetical protein
MREYIRELVYSDKIFDNPVLGKVSCGSFNETYTSCKDSNARNKTTDPCIELSQLASRCYSSRNNQDINDYIMNEFEESLLLLKFLEARQSTIPQKLASNSWAVFTNPHNLQLYEKVRRKEQRKASA